MTKAPERIERIVKFLCGAEPNESGECFSEAAERERGKFWWRKWVRQLEREAHDHALALVAEEREACAKIVYQHALKNGRKIPPTYDRIRTRTDDDAQAALEARDARIRNEALREAAEAVYRSDLKHDAYDEILDLITEDQSDE